MGARLGRMPSAVSWLFLCAGASITAAAAPSDEQLRGWVRDLAADSFAVREAAAEKLTVAGPRAMSLLSKCVSSGSAEAAWRASAVLVAIESASQGASIVEAAESPTDPAQCNDNHSATDPANPSPAPGPPPETDIAQALAPPPEPLPLEAFAEPVLIADAYVSPQLTGEQGIVKAALRAVPPSVRIAPAPLISQPSRSIADVPVVRGNSGVTFVHYPAARTMANANRENQPRWMNFLNRTRTMFGLTVR